MNLEELNKSQLDAVLCIDAPSLVIAGAGSGKTRVLTYKVAYLLEQGLQPWNILALTFTNKAAREMRERIATLVSPEKAEKLWMGTFHSIFARILRFEGHRLGYDANYTIYDTNDSLSLLKLIIREMSLDEKVYKPSAVQSRISAAKNRLVLPSAYNSVREFRDSDQMTKRTLMSEIYNRYQERLKQSNAMDFDDLLLNMWLLLKHNPEVADAWQERFHFVLVDEYQDTRSSGSSPTGGSASVSLATMHRASTVSAEPTSTTSCTSRKPTPAHVSSSLNATTVPPRPSSTLQAASSATIASR